MRRRDFLSLIAGAPIAALAPWTKIVQQPVTLLSNFTGSSFLVVSGGNGYYYQTTPGSVHVSRLYDENSWSDQWTDADRAARRLLGLPIIDENAGP